MWTAHYSWLFIRSELHTIYFFVTVPKLTSNRLICERPLDSRASWTTVCNLSSFWRKIPPLPFVRFFYFVWRPILSVSPFPSPLMFAHWSRTIQCCKTKPYLLERLWWRCHWIINCYSALKVRHQFFFFYGYQSFWDTFHCFLTLELCKPFLIRCRSVSPRRSNVGNRNAVKKKSEWHETKSKGYVSKNSLRSWLNGGFQTNLASGNISLLKKVYAFKILKEKKTTLFNRKDIFA